MTEEKEYLIIFDTCTEPDYYLDLHNLLALPIGSILQYQYKEKYISPSALFFFLNYKKWNRKPVDVLLFYSQEIGFRKGDKFNKHILPDQMLWIPTRIAQIWNSPTKIGESYHFDLKLLGYPIANNKVLTNKIVTPLIQQNTTPNNYWVSLSKDCLSFSLLDNVDHQTSWDQVVQQLHESETQFKNDVFWRINGLYEVKRGKLVEPKIVYYKYEVNKPFISSKATYFYKLYEGKSYVLQINSKHIPKEDEDKKNVYKLKINKDENSPINLPTSNKEVFLRHYTRELILLLVKVTEGIKPIIDKIEFETAAENQKTESDFPIGPNFAVQFEIRKYTAWLFLYFISAISGATILALARDIWSVSPKLALVLLPLGFIQLALSGLFFTGKLRVK